jgi:hypothetical protein
MNYSNHLLLTPLLLAFSIIFQSCGNGEVPNSTNELKNTVKKSNKNIPSNLEQKVIKYGLKIETIDSVQFHSIRVKSNFKQNPIEKITNFETAKKMLKGVVFFNDEDSEIHAVLKIRFRNGKVNNYNVENEQFYFVAYYPTEDILFSEGGHSADLSFNLKNGEETELTGNPEYIVASPNNLFRINGHYEGQQCSSYFIQQKKNGNFQKIIQLDKEFQEQLNFWLCVVGEVFWQNDTTFYLIEESGYSETGLIKRYFRIKLIEK